MFRNCVDFQLCTVFVVVVVISFLNLMSLCYSSVVFESHVCCSYIGPKSVSCYGPAVGPINVTVSHIFQQRR